MKNSNTPQTKTPLQIRRSKVMAKAMQLVKKGYDLGTAQRMSWSDLKLQEALKLNLIEITYLKKDGTTAVRLGTTNVAILPVRKPSNKIATKKRITSTKTTYYEIGESNGFKSYLCEYLISWKVAIDIKALVLEQVTAPVAMPAQTMGLQLVA